MLHVTRLQYFVFPHNHLAFQQIYSIGAQVLICYSNEKFSAARHEHACAASIVYHSSQIDGLSKHFSEVQSDDLIGPLSSMLLEQGGSSMLIFIFLMGFLWAIAKTITYYMNQTLLFAT